MLRHGRWYSMCMITSGRDGARPSILLRESINQNQPAPPTCFSKFMWTKTRGRPVFAEVYDVASEDEDYAYHQKPLTI